MRYRVQWTSQTEGQNGPQPEHDQIIEASGQDDLFLKIVERNAGLPFLILSLDILDEPGEPG